MKYICEKRFSFISFLYFYEFPPSLEEFFEVSKKRHDKQNFRAAPLMQKLKQKTQIQ